MIRSLVRQGLNVIARCRWRSRLCEAVLGPASNVAMWRVRPIAGNQLIVGEQSIVDAKVLFERAGARLIVGDRSFIGAATLSIAERLTIGSDVLMAWGVTVFDHGSHSVRFSERRHDVTDWLAGARQGKNWDTVAIRPVEVGDKAWIGFNAIILSGVSIGEGAVVGTGSVVTTNVEPWTIVAGNPARFIRDNLESKE